MKYLYLVLNFGSLLIPFLFSFHPRLKFFRYWKALFISMMITMLIFIPWDVLFTVNGIWGFNDDYFTGFKILYLPIEEWLFFVCIPFACVFTHYALLELYPALELNIKMIRMISYTCIFIFALLALMFHENWYTFVNFSYAAILLIIVNMCCIDVLRSYVITFLVMLLPFFIVNGILTGSFIENEVVWYNNSENLNFRLFTIPVEDTVYAFTLILTNLTLTQFFYKRMS